MTIDDLGYQDLVSLLARYQLTPEQVAEDSPIPGSFWGDSEAGLIGSSLYLRRDTPVHSALHEACHYVCMSADRRGALHTNAAGDYDEENAVCYLQIILAQYLPSVGSARIMQDMDRWGYSFRLGSTKAWYNQDAEDAHSWLLAKNLINAAAHPTWRLRD
jgi:hypothetical protein